MFVAEVPQVDGQLTQLVGPQIAVSQQDTEEGEGQSALAAQALLQEWESCVSETPCMTTGCGLPPRARESSDIKIYSQDF